MQQCIVTLHQKQKKVDLSTNFSKKLGSSLLCGSDGSLAELLEIFHEFEGSLAGTGAGSFVTLYDLSFCVNLEELDVFVDLFNKLFHFDVV